jgi:adhesin/invasin
MSFASSRFRLARTRLALVAGAVLAVACSSSSEPKIPPKDLVPATLTSDVSGTFTAVAGSTIATPLSVTVTNKAGEPLDTVLVTFAVTSGGGTLGSTTVRTTAGKASTTWTLGPTVGTQTVTATVGTLAPVTFTANATVGAAAKIIKNSVDPQTAVAGANVAVAPSVKVTDANNNPVANVLVSFAVASGGGTATGNLANTDANGVATVGA